MENDRDHLVDGIYEELVAGLPEPARRTLTRNVTPHRLIEWMRGRLEELNTDSDDSVELRKINQPPGLGIVGVRLAVTRECDAYDERLDHNTPVTINRLLLKDADHPTIEIIDPDLAKTDCDSQVLVVPMGHMSGMIRKITAMSTALCLDTKRKGPVTRLPIDTTLAVKGDQHWRTYLAISGSHGEPESAPDEHRYDSGVIVTSFEKPSRR